ncbi:MAG TPA: amidohydrolase family protein [Gemmatimonadales bacterium]|nr:amidohydrolase family protein [Gemmatimonadales bacterium]
MRVDVNSVLGSYPFRKVPGTSPEALLRAMDRVGVDLAWVSHLPSIFWRDPAQGNPWLYETADRQERFKPVPAVHPGVTGWQKDVEDARKADAPAIRCDPTYYGIDPSGPSMQEVARACSAEGVPLMMAVRLEDARQRHPNDRAAELPPWSVRQLVRSDSGVRLIITHADRPFIEEVHFGSTPEESSRIWWDICWIWGPPEDHLETLLRTIGPERFLFGTGQPLRLPEAGLAKMDLLELPAEQRRMIETENIAALRAPRARVDTRSQRA